MSKQQMSTKNKALMNLLRMSWKFDLGINIYGREHVISGAMNVWDRWIFTATAP
jgi:hypothetical protein